MKNDRQVYYAGGFSYPSGYRARKESKKNANVATIIFAIVAVFACVGMVISAINGN